MKQNEIIIYGVLISIIFIGICYWINKSEKKEKEPIKKLPTPACDRMKFYDSDYMILATAIHQARLPFELDIIRNHIQLFNWSYMQYQCSKELSVDVNRLFSQCTDKQTELEIRMALLN